MTDATYTAYIERDNGVLREFPDVANAMKLPTGNVHVTTADGATLTVPKGDIIRLRRTKTDDE